MVIEVKGSRQNVYTRTFSPVSYSFLSLLRTVFDGAPYMYVLCHNGSYYSVRYLFINIIIVLRLTLKKGIPRKGIPQIHYKTEEEIELGKEAAKRKELYQVCFFLYYLFLLKIYQI